MVQVENEYGSYHACDKNYRLWLRDETLAHVKEQAVLFTNDGPDQLNCGYIENVLATLDFGQTKNLTNVWRKLRRYMPKGPLVNAEYYPGWLTHWTEPVARVATADINKTFIDMLNDGASVNFYMFYGGTNFGFTSGANDGGPYSYQPQITSYDYDAPMNEAGDATPKYFELRDIIERYLPLPNTIVPKPLPKKKYGTVRLVYCCNILSPAGRRTLSSGVYISNTLKTFEDLHQYSGLVLYETILPAFKKDPIVLNVPGVHDRAYVYANGKYVGLISRETNLHKLALSATASKGILQILVENQGRINYGNLTDRKGLTNELSLDKKVLLGWNMTKFPLESYADLKKLINLEGDNFNLQMSQETTGGPMWYGPGIFYGVLNVTEEPCDTYLNTNGWGKGFVFVNGENLGRYWPLAGPQVTLYVPREVLTKGANEIVLIEYQYAAEDHKIAFTDHHIWN